MNDISPKLLRRLLDALVILPTVLILILFIADVYLHIRNTGPLFWLSFVLILGLMVKSWLKPQSIAEKKDELLLESLRMRKKLQKRTELLDRLKEQEKANPGSNMTDINVHENVSHNLEAQLETLRQKVTELTELEQEFA